MMKVGPVILVPVCPHCGAEVTIKDEPTPEPKYTRISIEEYLEDRKNRSTCDAHWYRQKQATCKFCGVVKEWSE